MEYSSIMSEMIVGFSSGVVELAPRKPPPLVPRCLMISSGGDGTHGDGLEGALQCIHHDVGLEVLGHALPHQQQAAHDGERQQQAGW